MSSIYGKEYIGPHDQKRGLESFDVKRVETADDLPDNIYACYETDPQKAIREMYWAVHTEPYNAAVWLGLDEIVPAADRKEITEKLFDPSPVIGLKQTTTSPEDLKALEGTLGLQWLRSDAQAHKKWLDHTTPILRAINEAFGEAAETAYAFNGTLNHQRGHSKTKTHTDTPKPKTTVIDETTEEEVALDTKTRIIWNQAQNGGTWLADADDIIPDETGQESAKYRFASPHITFYETPPWMPAMIRMNDDRPTMSSVHTIANKLGKETLDRQVWTATTNVDDDTIAELFRDEYPSFLEKLAQDSRHQRIIASRASEAEIETDKLTM